VAVVAVGKLLVEQVDQVVAVMALYILLAAQLMEQLIQAAVVAVALMVPLLLNLAVQVS
jgi:hypothetical protein